MYVTILFPARPLIEGLDIPGPELIIETPGIFKSEYEKLLALMIFKSFKLSLSTLRTLFFTLSLKGVEIITSSRLTLTIVSLFD